MGGKMSRRHRAEVFSRLVILISHWLKWEYQSTKQTRSWSRTIEVQQISLLRLFARGVLRNHAEDVLEDVYRDAVILAVQETGLDESVFPKTSPYTAAQWVALPAPEGDVP
jgi:hypothetical protein